MFIKRMQKDSLLYENISSSRQMKREIRRHKKQMLLNRKLLALLRL